MKPSFLTVFLAVGGFRMSEAFLKPPCSTMPTTPACTNDLSQVTPTLPRCVVPAADFLNCRAIPGMPPVAPGVSIVPTWFDYNRGRRGQMITSEYRLPWYANMFNGLLVEMNMPDVLYPLLFNKKNTNAVTAGKRDLATIMQGMVWTKDYLWKMPQTGHSNWIQSIQSVRNTHKDVQSRGNATLQTLNCIIFPEDYDYITNDVVWDAVETDLAASNLLTGPGGRDPPVSTWLTCPDTTTCGLCGNNCSPNCVDICLENPNYFPSIPFIAGAVNTLSLSNAVIQGATLTNGTVFDATFSSVYFSGGTWVNGTSGGTLYQSQMQSGTITSATIQKGRYTTGTKIKGGILANLIYQNGAIVSGSITNGTICTVLYTNCTDCTTCNTCAWTPPNCYYANPPTFDCDNCLCDPDGLNCNTCTSCNNFDKCVQFPIPLYNQQAMSFVVYNLVGFVVLWPAQIGMNACDADLWAFVHLWSGILGALGVEDQCNLLLQPDIATARTYFQQIFNIYVLPTLFDFPKPTRFMMDNVFKGLQLLTGTLFSPELLLCRFVRDFLQVPATNICNLMSAKDQFTDSALTGAYMPVFMNNKLYRAFINTGMDDLFYQSAQVLMPFGNCTNYPSIATSCFV